MPYHTFSIGEEVTAADFQTYVGNQVVAQFEDAAQRDLQLPGPLKGQLCTLDTYAGALWIYDGSDWVEPAPYTQGGYSAQTTNAGAGGAVTYPKPFAAGNVAITLTNAADDGIAAYGMQFGLIEDQNLSYAFGFIARFTNGTLATDHAVKLYWTAQGFRSPD